MGFRQIKTDISVEGAIVKAIAFFDLFSYPLTAFEIWKYVDMKGDLVEVLEILNSLTERGSASSLEAEPLKEILDEKNGFYFLAGRDEVVKERMARYNYTDKKFKRAVLLSRIFKFIPWIKMIAVGNIIGAHNLKKESDIDLFIITKSGRVWLTRFFCVLIIKILGLRPKPEKIQDKICLSFFISEETMDLEGLMLPDGSDIYFIHWLAGLVPVYDKDNTYDKFIKANDWLKNYLPNWQRGEVNYRRDAGKGFSWFYRDVFDMFFGGLERRIKKLQLKIMPDMIRQAMNKDTRVVVGDHIIKLHANDRREYYQRKFNQRLTALGKADFDLIEGV